MEDSKALLSSMIIHIDMILLDETKAVTPSYQWLSYVFMSEEITFDLFKVAYHIFSLIFSLLYTSGVVYTIACIYTGREVTLKKVMSIVPKVRKRLMLTFLCNFVAHFAYNVAALIFAVINFPILIRMDNYFLPLLCVLFIFYLVGLVRIHGHCLAISQRCDRVGRHKRVSCPEKEQGTAKGQHVGGHVYIIAARSLSFCHTKFISRAC
ncbi:hypothetical protein I3842_15G024000 [Carya illinoinensis]|uniref:Uncharacterized protein n=1 Tax=Carya illinoinensis TaxID=32201 RepID=A0A922D601_CARIL|nr:hypothetical protein I3842_15G024000 [Carya illinoinensis]